MWLKMRQFQITWSNFLICTGTVHRKYKGTVHIAFSIFKDSYCFWLIMCDWVVPQEYFHSTSLFSYKHALSLTNMHYMFLLLSRHNFLSVCFCLFLVPLEYKNIIWQWIQIESSVPVNIQPHICQDVVL